MEIRKFIDVHVPIFYCNLKCEYCYVSQNRQNTDKPYFKYAPEIVKRALTQERLGGICHFNVCGMGETLIPEEVINYIRVILENGHTVMIVTNGTLTNRFRVLMEFPIELKKRLGFKFSFHYLELQRLSLLDVFWENVDLVRKNGCSYSIELTPSDVYEPYIDEIKKNCLEHVGAYCHISVPRDEATGGIRLLSKHSLKEFYKIWNTFESPMFDLKMRHWEEKRNEFCYAGLWSGLLNIGNGEYNSCYRQPKPIGNLFEKPEEPFSFFPEGKCEVPHCFNGHSFLAWGIIPEIKEESYCDIRDRVNNEGKHWINDIMRDQFSCKLYEYNKCLTDDQKSIYIKEHNKRKRSERIHRITNRIKRGLYKIGSKR